jgi:hypothetical protein
MVASAHRLVTRWNTGLGPDDEPFSGNAQDPSRIGRPTDFIPHSDATTARSLPQEVAAAYDRGVYQSQ